MGSAMSGSTPSGVVTVTDSTRRSGAYQITLAAGEETLLSSNSSVTASPLSAMAKTYHCPVAAFVMSVKVTGV